MSFASTNYDEAMTTTPSKQTKSKGWEYYFSKNFTEIDKTKNDLHKILDNFYLKPFLIEDKMSYDSLQSVTQFLIISYLQEKNEILKL